MTEDTDQRALCPSCGEPVEEGAFVCPHCGASLVAPEEEGVCPYCGARLVEGRCVVCGLLEPERDAETSARRWTMMAMGVAVVALIGFAWLARPWEELPNTPTPDLRTRYAVVERPTATPTPTLTATLAPTAEAITYVVQPDETVEQIAERYGITVAQLLAANNLTEADALNPGQELRIPSADVTQEPTPGEAVTPAGEMTPTPAPTLEATATSASPSVYIVQAGDILGRIALQFGLSTEELARANGISEETVLQIGQELIIPSTAAQPSSSPTGAPSPSPSPTPEEASAPVIHVVKPGEHLGIIAPLYGLDQETVARANNIGVDDILSVGQELVIPVGPPAGGAEDSALEKPATYTVQSGDVLGRIALKFGLSTEELARANGLSEDSVLQIGQELVIPAEAAPNPTEIASPTITPTVSTSSANPLEATPTATSQPTVTPTPANFIYPAPSLVTPVNGARVKGGAEAQILVAWTSVGILEEDEWYRLSLWRPTVQEEETVILTKATSWRVLPSLYPQAGEPRTFWWQVKVVEDHDDGSPQKPLSPGSSVYRFIWE